MDTRKVLVTLALAVLLVAVAVVGKALLGGFTPASLPFVPQVAQGPEGFEVRVVTRSFSDGPATVRAEFPRFPGAPDLSAQVDDYVESVITEFRENVRANDAARRETTPPGEVAPDFEYTLHLSWDPAQVNEQHVSFVLRTDAYEGGANMRQDVVTYSYDVKARRAVSLADLFPGDPGYLERVSAYARQVLESQLGDATSAEFLDAGTAPTLENFSRFTFTDDAVAIYFPKYQVAPGAAGEQRVVLPRNLEGLF